MNAWGRARIALIVLGVVAILFVFVFPTRSYLAQRSQVAGARNDVAVLKAQNAKLEQEAARLQSRDEIERMARDQFNMRYPNEQVFKVMPAPAGTPTTTVP